MKLEPDAPPEDPEPEPGDTVIELINGVPHISIKKGDKK